MSKFVTALNSVAPPVWAFAILLVGCAAVLMFHKAGVDIGIAAGIIGAAVNMFTGFGKDTHGNPTQPGTGPEA